MLALSRALLWLSEFFSDVAEWSRGFRSWRDIRRGAQPRPATPPPPDIEANGRTR